MKKNTFTTAAYIYGSGHAETARIQVTGWTETFFAPDGTAVEVGLYRTPAKWKLPDGGVVREKGDKPAWRIVETTTGLGLAMIDYASREEALASLTPELLQKVVAALGRRLSLPEEVQAQHVTEQRKRGESTGIKKADYYLALSNGDYKAVSGWRVDLIAPNGEVISIGLNKRYGRWNVTHIATGFGLGDSFASRSEAMAYFTPDALRVIAARFAGEGMTFAAKRLNEYLQ